MPLTSPIKRWSTIGLEEKNAVLSALDRPLSGYLAGEHQRGMWVQALEEAWAGRFGVKHAIACNSATSGLLAACKVCGPEWQHQDIAVPCFTMSATAAAPQIAWNNYLIFMDCDPETYISTPHNCPNTHVGLVIVTDLFGQAAPLTKWREFCDKELKCCLIEDASQAPFAVTEDGKLAGTVGDVGVFSLNVHKHLQAGEGGIMVTNCDETAERLRCFINHGELRKDVYPGLNLRMTEVTAAIGYIQLSKADEIIASRIALAEELSDMVKDFWTPPVAYGKHVYYHWAIRVPNRKKVIKYLQSEGVPVRAGYVDPLYRLPAFSGWRNDCPVAEKLHDEELMIFEVCSFDPTTTQLEEMREIFKWAYDGS